MQPNAARAHILVVDDTPAILRLLQVLLRSDGYSVVVASSGAEALRHASEHYFDLLILDLLMPHMSGWEVLEQLHALGLELPTVVLTADARGRLEAQARSVAASLMKPFDVDELLQTVARLTDGVAHES